MTPISVSVITPTLPGRERWLSEAVASVEAQATPPLQHLVLCDEGEEGPALTRNRLAEQAAGEWILPLDDDDLLDVDHLEALSPYLGGDVVYSWCRVEGRPGWSPNRLFHERSLRLYNFIPVTALIKRSSFLGLGGFRDVGDGSEVHDLWLRGLDAGWEFRCVPEVLWTLRVMDDDVGVAA
jgi:glycosyltransferase involved in cell wall biosynthesis